MTLLADTLEHAGNIDGGINTAFTVPKRLDAALPVPPDGLDSHAALADYKESAKIFRKLVAADASDADARARLENILIRTGDLQISIGALDAALATHKEALTISSELLSADSGNTDWKRRVEVNHVKFFTVYMARTDFDEALAQATEAEEIGRRLYDLDPENFLWRRDYGGRFRNLGVALRAKKDMPAARDNFDKSLAISRETMARHPSDPVAHIELALSLYLAGRDRAPTEAAPLFQEAVGELEGLDRKGALPKANANWTDVIRKKLAAAEATEAAK